MPQTRRSATAFVAAGVVLAGTLVELIAGEGDSGGPIFVPINGINQPNSAADARGLVSSRPDGWGPVRCPDPWSGGSRDCATAIWFTDVLSAIRPWAASGMYVKTS